jgi:hypothetical protein
MISMMAGFVIFGLSRSAAPLSFNFDVYFIEIRLLVEKGPI